MNPDKFTIKAQETLSQMQSLATTFSHQELTDLHLVKALLAVENNIVVPILQKLGANPLLLDQDITAKLNSLPTVKGGTVYVGTTLQKLLTTAEKFAKTLGDT